MGLFSQFCKRLKLASSYSLQSCSSANILNSDAKSHDLM